MATSGRPLDESTRRLIHWRLGKGDTRREIMREAGVCRRTVDREAKRQNDPVTECLDDESEEV